MARGTLGLAVLMVGCGFVGTAVYHAVVPEAAMAQPAGAPVVADGEVRAVRFVLTDEVGGVIATLGAYEPTLAAGDTTPRAVKEMVGLVIYGEDGRPSVQLGRGGPVAALEMRGEAGWLSTGVYPDGGGMGIWVPEQTLRFGMGFQKDGNGGFIVRDRSSRDRFAAGMPPHAGMSMSLKGDDGQTLWSAP